jgi:PAS domain S-box-containing protein
MSHRLSIDTSNVKVPVLLVDDRPGNLLALEALLGSRDYELVSVRSGREALAALERQDFAVVLLDILMPDMDGIETVRAIRGIAKEARPTPIIFVTGFDMAPSGVLEAYAGGAVDFVQKPLEPLILRSKVAVFAELYRARLEAASSSAQRQVRLLVDTIPALAWYAEPDGYIPWYNQRWFEYTGTNLDEQVGWAWQSVHDPADLPRIMAGWKKALASGEPWEDEFRLRRHDGQFRWFLARAMPLRDAQGKILQWFGTNVDIDEQKRAEVAARRHARARIRASEERFHRLVDAVTEYAIFMLDPTGRVATWNPGAERIKGYRSEEIIGQHFSVFYTPEDRAAGRPEEVLDIVRREGRFEEENWRIRKDGSRFYAYVVISALRDSEGQVTGFAKVTRDLTAKRAAEENDRQLTRERIARASSEAERKRLLSLLGEVPAIVNVLRGPEFVFEFAHPKEIASLGGRELVGRPLLEAIPESRDQPKILERLRRVYETGQPSAVQDSPRLVVNNGVEAVTYWDSVYLPLFDPAGAVEGIMTFDLDVTPSVVARREMERVDRAKDEFLATMSHELRTPLNAIYGWATILRRKPREEDKLDRGLEVIERNAKTQGRLVSDLLDVSRIITGKLELKVQRVDVFPVIMSAVDVVRPAAEAKAVRLVIDVDPEIGETIADPDRLQQIVWNLLSNAVRFTPRGGRVTIFGDRTSAGIVIRVKDTGAGIAVEHLPHIFERFMQVDSSTTRAHGGLGLGLSIVRHLVEAHGGVVEAESEGLGHGATFSVTLPIRAVMMDREERRPHDAAQRAPGVETLGTEAPTRLDGVRLLVVDDDSESLEVLRTVLTTACAAVTTAASAREAFELLDTGGPFDLIISDIGMPEVDGYSFMRTLRAGPVAVDVPAIALTAYARSEDAERAKRAGYQDHLAKPVDESLLLKTITTWSRAARTNV